MTTLKIVFKAGDKQTVLYAQGIKQMWQVESHVLERLGQVERNALTNATFRKYWIDEEQDGIEIINDADFEFFIKRTGSHKTPKIYFEATAPKQGPAEEPQSTSTPTVRNEESLSVHPTVECDVCLKAPIRGFRYKCLQCPNFDLCMKCESEMKHPDHLMLRIPHANAPKLETVCPISGLFGKHARRQQKQAARAAAAANATALGAESSAGEGKSRHHRHHRRQCTGGAGIFSNFYDMMQDLAEGGGVPQSSAETPKKQGQEQASAPQQPGSPIEHIITSVKVAAEAAAKEAATAAAAASVAAAASATAANNISKETNTSSGASSTTSTGAGPQTPPTTPTAAGIPVTPSLENLIDPQFMKAGIQILNNFSEMFGKILDPVVTDGASRTSSAPESVVTVDIDLTGDNGARATPPPAAAETPNKAGSSNQSSKAGSGLVTPMETETAATPQPTVAVAAAAAESAQPRSRNSQSEENDWTMIDSSVVSNSEGPSSSASATAAAAAAAAATTTPIDFAKLSQQLQTHIENEMKSVSFEIPSPAASVTPPQVAAPAPVSVPAPTPAAVPAPAPTPAPTPESTERRAVAVFHADPRINSAVHGMMAMGFSNEGAVLTQLLESVNGSIPLALDLMTAAQRN